VLPLVLALSVVAVSPAAVTEEDCPADASEAARAEAQLLLKTGQEHLATGLFAQGEEELRAAARLDPASAFPPYALGLALMDRQRFPEAVLAFTACREALRCLREGDPKARERFLGDLDDEIRELRTVLSGLERDRLVRQAVKGQELNGGDRGRLGESAQAVHALEQRLADLVLLRHRPDREPAGLAVALGNAHFHAGELEEAEREFRFALATEPKSGDAHNNLAVVLMLEGKLDEATREVKAAEKAGAPVAPRLKEEIQKRRAAPPPP
jgi:tetratricopeptide (TPR) repeat protein